MVNIGGGGPSECQYDQPRTINRRAFRPSRNGSCSDTAADCGRQTTQALGDYVRLTPFLPGREDHVSFRRTTSRSPLVGNPFRASRRDPVALREEARGGSDGTIIRDITLKAQSMRTGTSPASTTAIGNCGTQNPARGPVQRLSQSRAICARHGNGDTIAANGFRFRACPTERWLCLSEKHSRRTEVGPGMGQPRSFFYKRQVLSI